MDIKDLLIKGSQDPKSFKAMKEIEKSVISINIGSDLIALLDKLCYETGLSRSSLADSILRLKVCDETFADEYYWLNDECKREFKFFRSKVFVERKLLEAERKIEADNYFRRMKGDIINIIEFSIAEKNIADLKRLRDILETFYVLENVETHLGKKFDDILKELGEVVVDGEGNSK